MATQPQIQGFTDFQFSSEGARFTVWTACKASIDKTVDVLVPSDGVSAAQKAHLLRMARRIARLNSAALPQIYDIGDGDSPYIVGEHIEAPSIEKMVGQRGPLGAKEALLVAAGVAEALAAAQTQFPLVLRNIKPQNIRVDGAAVRITDFSLSIVAGDPEDGPAADEDEIVGTPSFISPEHAAQSPAVDFRSDIYSLGLTLYFATTGATPFDSSDPIEILGLQQIGELTDVRQLNPKLPPAFSLLLGRMLMKDPGQRYSSWGELLEDIRRLIAGRPLSSRQVRPDAKQTMRTAIQTQPARQEPAAASQDAAKTPPPKPKSHPIAWLLLLAWLAIFANARMGNPLKLPPALAPDALRDPLKYLNPKTANSPTPNSSTPNSQTSKRPLAQIPPNPNATLGSSAPHTSAPGNPETSKTRNLETQKPGNQETSKPAPSRDVPTARNPDLATALRAGDFAAARKALANDIDAEDAAKMLGEMLSIDEAAGDAILLRRGEEVNLTYMGKTRAVTPVSRVGGTLVVKFTAGGAEKEIKMDLQKVPDSEKLAFMNRWASDQKSHAVAAALALRVGDDRAFRVHAADSGPLAPFFNALRPE